MMLGGWKGDCSPAGK